MLSSTGKRFKCKPMRYGTGTCNMETLLITVDQLYKEYSDVRHYVAICVEQGVGTVGLARWRYCAVRRLFAGKWCIDYRTIGDRMSGLIATNYTIGLRFIHKQDREISFIYCIHCRFNS